MSPSISASRSANRERRSARIARTMVSSALATGATVDETGVATVWAFMAS